MSKMGEELERRLDENKYELWEAVKAVDLYLTLSYPHNLNAKPHMAALVEEALAKIEGK